MMRERERERERESLLAYDYLHMPMMTNFASVWLCFKIKSNSIYKFQFRVYGLGLAQT